MWPNQCSFHFRFYLGSQCKQAQIWAIWTCSCCQYISKELSNHPLYSNHGLVFQILKTGCPSSLQLYKDERRQPLNISGRLMFCFKSQIMYVCFKHRRAEVLLKGITVIKVLKGLVHNEWMVSLSQEREGGWVACLLMGIIVSFILNRFIDCDVSKRCSFTNIKVSC